MLLYISKWGADSQWSSLQTMHLSVLLATSRKTVKPTHRNLNNLTYSTINLKRNFHHNVLDYKIISRHQVSSLLQLNQSNLATASTSWPSHYCLSLLLSVVVSSTWPNTTLIHLESSSHSAPWGSSTALIRNPAHITSLQIFSITLRGLAEWLVWVHC